MATLQEFHCRAGEPALADMLGRVVLIGEGSSTFLINPDYSPHTVLSKMLAVYATRVNTTYDVDL